MVPLRPLLRAVVVSTCVSTPDSIQRVLGARHQQLASAAPLDTAGQAYPLMVGGGKNSSTCAQAPTCMPQELRTCAALATTDQKPQRVHHVCRQCTWMCCAMGPCARWRVLQNLHSERARFSRLSTAADTRYATPNLVCQADTWQAAARTQPESLTGTRALSTGGTTRWSSHLAAALTHSAWYVHPALPHTLLHGIHMPHHPA